jgi:hypothetical protein
MHNCYTVCTPSRKCTPAERFGLKRARITKWGSNSRILRHNSLFLRCGDPEKQAQDPYACTGSALLSF